MEQANKSSSKSIKRLIKVMAYTISVLVLLPAIIALLLLIPIVQNKVVDLATQYLSEYLGSEVSIDHIYIKPITTVSIEGLLVRDVFQDTMLYAGTVDLNFSGIEKHTHAIQFNLSEVSQTYFNLSIKAGDSLSNLNYFINALPSSESNSDSPVWIECRDLVIENLKFRFDNYNIIPQAQGKIDFSHIYLTGINGEFNNIVAHDDSIMACVERLELLEKSGFQLKALKGEAIVSSTNISLDNMALETNNSKVYGNYAMKTKGWSSYSDFFTEVVLKSKLYNSDIQFNDIAFFAPGLKDLLIPIKFSGNVNGPLSNLRAQIDSLFFGDSGKLTGRAKLKGLPNVNSLFLDADIQHLYVSAEDAEKVNIPGSEGLFKLSLPTEAKKLGYTVFHGKFVGFFNDFVAYGNGETALGSFKTDINVKSSRSLITYSGRITAEGFQIGRMFSIEDAVRTVGFSLELKGKGLERSSMQMEAVGTIHNIDILGYNYRNLEIDAALMNQAVSGKLVSMDTNANLALEGKFQFGGKIPKINAQACVANLRLGSLGIVKSDTFGKASGNIALELLGNSLADMHGSLQLKNFKYSNRERHYESNEMILVDDLVKEGHSIRFKNESLDFAIFGNTTLADFPYAFIKVGKRYAPAFFKNFDLTKQDTTQDFHFDIRLENELELTSFIIPNFRLSEPLVIKGNLKTEKEFLKIEMDSLSWRIGANHGNGQYLKLFTEGGFIKLDSKIEKLSFSEKFMLENQEIHATLRNDSLITDLSWNNHTEMADSGFLTVVLYWGNEYPINAVLSSCSFRMAEVNWRLNKKAELHLDSNRIHLRNLDLYSSIGAIVGSGTFDKRTNEHLLLDIKDFDLTYLSDFKFIDQKLGGHFSGILDLHQKSGSAVLDAQMIIDSLAIDDIQIGEISGTSKYSDQNQSLDLRIDLSYKDRKNINLQGYYFPFRNNDQIDLVVNLNEFRAEILEPFMGDIMHAVGGNIDGKVSIHGNLFKPELRGQLQLNDIEAVVTYLNTRYHIPHAMVDVSNELFALNGASILDNQGRQGTLVASVIHENFTNWNYDVFATVQRMEALNTTIAQNESYYGRATFTGEVGISGTTNSTKIEVNGKTADNTTLVIPLSGSTEVGQSEFIRFVQSKDKLKLKSEVLTEELSGLEMDFRLSVNDSAEVQLIFDEKIGDVIKVQGFGDMLMQIDNKGKFNMYGDYNISRGDYLFTLQNVINKRFTVAPGGKVAWNGNPYEAKADITAIYSLRASPSVMMQSIDPTNKTYEKRMPVNVSLNIRGALLEPVIAFDVDLPNLPQSDLANQMLDRGSSTEQAINQEAFSLLIAKTFAPLGGGVELGGAGSSNTYDMLTNQFSNWASQYFDNTDIGIDYNQGDGVTTGNQLEVGITRQVKNRWTFEVNGTAQGGVNGSNSGYSQQSQTPLMGEFDIEYRINKSGTFRTHVFNKANNYDAINQNQSPYTYGTGLYFQKEFNTLGDLLKRNKNLEKQKNVTEDEDNSDNIDSNTQLDGIDKR